jgi:predicted RecB family nuclease
MLPVEDATLHSENIMREGVADATSTGENSHNIYEADFDLRDPRNHPVESIYGVGQRYSERLRDAGIYTIGDVAKIRDIEEFEDLLGISGKTLSKIRLRALSYVSGEVIQISAFEFPGDRLIYMDIETDDRCRRVWLIGLLVDGRFTQFYADSWDGEKDILERFLEFLDNHRGYTLVTYSGTGFDTRVTLGAARRLGLDPTTLLDYPHVDLCSLLRRCFIFPHSSYALKELGSHLAYGFRQTGLDGLRVAQAYQRHVESGLPLQDGVLEYNEDDVRVAHHLVNRCFLLGKHNRDSHLGHLHIESGRVMFRTRLDPWLIDNNTPARAAYTP